MLWHERDARSPAHRWLRDHLSTMVSDDSFARGQQKLS